MSKRWELLEGEALALLREMPDASVDAVVTDPPYCSTGEATSMVTARGRLPREHQFYEAWLREHVVEFARILKPTGAMWMTIDWRGAMALDVACARLNLREPKVGVWNRGGLGMGFVLRNVYECFAVVPMPKFQRMQTAEPDVWDEKWTPGNRKHGHQAEKPVPLMRRAIRLVCPSGGTVLDPFAGSGSTGVGALLEDRSFLGIEREPAYAEIARARLTEAERQAEEQLLAC